MCPRECVILMGEPATLPAAVPVLGKPRLTHATFMLRILSSSRHFRDPGGRCPISVTVLTLTRVEPISTALSNK